MTQEQHNSIRDNVLSAIEQGKVKMRPKWYFVARAALFTVGVLCAALLLLFVGSFVVFLLHQNGVWFAPAFGRLGVKDFLFALPVVFLFLVIGLVILLEILIRRYAFAYHRPAIYSVVAVVFFLGIGSVAIAQFQLHEMLLMQARNNQLPVAGELYRQFGVPRAEHVTPGIILQRNEGGFIMRDPFGEEYIVIIVPETRLPYGAEFDVADYVVVLGHRVNRIINAEGIREIKPRPSLFKEKQHMQP